MKRTIGWCLLVALIGTACGQVNYYYECYYGEKRCDGNSVIECRQDRTFDYEHGVYCGANTCVDGVCEPPPPCITGTRRCQDDALTPALCNKAGQWVALAACSTMCVDGQCTEPPPPPPCVLCGDISPPILPPDQYMFCSDASAMLYAAAWTCLCEPGNPCESVCNRPNDLCQSVMVSKECETCILDTVNGCANAVTACFNDI